MNDIANDFVEHTHPQYGGGYFCTPDVFERIATLSHPATQTGALQAVRNQCDGCASNAPINKFGHHRYGDGSLIACTADRYQTGCVCGHPDAPGVTHRAGGPCFHEDTHQDFHPLAATQPNAAPGDGQGALDRAITFKGKDYMGTLYECIERAYQAGIEDAAPSTATAAREQVAEEDAYVIDRLGKVLAGVAIALKGDELPLHRHSYHDLEDFARTMKLELDLYRSLFPNGVPDAITSPAADPIASEPQPIAGSGGISSKEGK